MTYHIRFTLNLSFLLQPPEDIKPLIDTVVYHQFYDTDAVAGELEVKEKILGY